MRDASTLETVTGDSPADAGAVSERTTGALLMHIGPGAVKSVQPSRRYRCCSPRPDHGLEPTRRDDAGVHIDPGVRVDKGLITFHHERLEERNGRERGGHTLDEVDSVPPEPAVAGCRARWPWRPGIGLPPTGRTLNVGEQQRPHPRRSSRPVSEHPRRMSQQTRSYLAL